MAEDSAKVRTIWVVAHPEQGDRLAIWDRHPNHPRQPGQEPGEIYVAGQRTPPVEVAETPPVMDALSRGEGGTHARLIRLEGDALASRLAIAEDHLAEKAEARSGALAERAALRAAAVGPAMPTAPSGAAIPDVADLQAANEEATAINDSLRDTVEELQRRDARREKEAETAQGALDAKMAELDAAIARATAIADSATTGSTEAKTGETGDSKPAKGKAGDTADGK